MRYKVRPLESNSAYIVNADGPGYAAEKFCREFRGSWTGDETETVEVTETATDTKYLVTISCIVTKEYVGHVVRR